MIFTINGIEPDLSDIHIKYGDIIRLEDGTLLKLAKESNGCKDCYFFKNNECIKGKLKLTCLYCTMNSEWCNLGIIYKQID